MADTVAVLETILTGDASQLDALLARVDAQLKKAGTEGKRAGAQAGDGLADGLKDGAAAAEKAAAEIVTAQAKAERAIEELAQAQQKAARAATEAATAEQRLAQQTATTAAAQDRAAVAALRRAQAEERASSGMSRSTGLAGAFADGLSEVAGNFGLLAGGAGIATAAIGIAAAAMTDAAQRAATIKAALGDLGADELAVVDAAAATLAARFGDDVARQADAARVVMAAFGTDAKGAFDIIAAGYDAGLNVSGDFLDTLQEYAPQFAQLGFSADQALTLIQTAMKNGARNTDIVADSFKELNILLREADTAGNLDGLDQGLANVVRQFQAGAITGEQAFTQIIAGLAAIDDEALRRQAGVELFGTKFEDLGETAILSMGQVDGALITTAGGIDQLNTKITSLGEIGPRAFAALGVALQPVNEGLLQLANGGLAGIQMLTGQSNAIGQANAQLAAAAPSYEAYLAQMNAASSGIGVFIAQNQGLVAAMNAVLPGSAAVVTNLAGMVVQNQALSASQFALVESMTATGASVAEIDAALLTAGEALATYDQALVAAATDGAAAEAVMAALGPSLSAVAASSAEAAGQAEYLLNAYLDGRISAEQLAASIAALETSTIAVAAAKRDSAGAADEQGAADGAAAGQALSLAEANAQAEAASNADAVAKLAQAAAAQETAQRHAELEAAILSAAGAGGSAEAAAARIAAKFNGVEAPAVVALINHYRELAAARANAAAAERAGASSLPDAVRRSMAASARAEANPYTPSRPRSTGGGGGSGGGGGRPRGGGGGGGGGGRDQAARETEAAARAEAQYQASLRSTAEELDYQREKLTTLKEGTADYWQTKTQIAQLEKKLESERSKDLDKLVDLERGRQEKLLKLTEDYAKKRAQAEKKFDQEKLESRYDFYKSLSSIEDQGLRQQASAEYEAAAVKAEELRATKGADVAEAYLAEQAQIIRDRTARQEEINQALAEGNAAQAEYLRGLDQLARNAENARLAEIESGEGSLQDQEQQDRAEIDQETAERQQELLGGSKELTAEELKRLELLALQTAEYQKQADLAGRGGGALPGLPPAGGEGGGGATPAAAAAAGGGALEITSAQLGELITATNQLLGEVRAAIGQGAAAQTQATGKGLADVARQIGNLKSGRVAQEGS